MAVGAANYSRGRPGIVTRSWHWRGSSRCGSGKDEHLPTNAPKKATRHNAHGWKGRHSAAGAREGHLGHRILRVVHGLRSLGRYMCVRVCGCKRVRGHCGWGKTLSCHGTSPSASHTIPTAETRRQRMQGSGQGRCELQFRSWSGSSRHSVFRTGRLVGSVRSRRGVYNRNRRASSNSCVAGRSRSSGRQGWGSQRRQSHAMDQSRCFTAGNCRWLVSLQRLQSWVDALGSAGIAGALAHLYTHSACQQRR